MRIFFSFSSRDMKDAAVLVTALRKKHDVFFSPDSIPHGAYWQPVLAEELAKADAFVLLVAGDKPGPWQMPEYHTANDRKVKQPDFPLIPIVAGTASTAFPFLSQINWIVAEGPLGEGTAALIESALSSKAEPTQQPWRHANPFRNLEALDEGNADLFFGRDMEINKAVSMLAGQHGQMLALVGSSGAGKSSLSMAGITAALRSQHLPGKNAHWPSALKDSRGWFFLKMKPGEKPVDQLAQAILETWQLEAGNPAHSGWKKTWATELLDGQKSVSDLCTESIGRFRALGMQPPSGIFLYIDQGEEAYRANADHSARFSALIGEALAVPGFRCMMSLRSDHYGFLQADTAVFPSTQVLDVPPLRQDQLAEIIRSAAGALKARFADETMSEDIAAAATGQPGALPLLSVYLTGIWEAMQRAGDGVLRLPATTSAIEISSVLREKAERYIRENPEKEETVRRLFVPRLVRVPKDGPALRRRATLNALTVEERQAADDLAGADHRLLVTSETNGEAMVEVAHEALFTAWDRLKNWIASRREFLEWKEGLEQDRKAWQAESRKRNLLMGGMLDRAEERLKSDGDDLDNPDKEFIGASTKANKWRQAKNVTAISLIVGLIAAVFGGGFYFLERTRAALQESLRNETRYIAATADSELNKGNATLALKIALEGLPQATKTKDQGRLGIIWQAIAPLIDGKGVRREMDKSISDAIWGAWQSAHFAIGEPIRHVNSANFSPDSTRIVTASFDGTARIWNVTTGVPIGEPMRHENALNSATFSPDGTRIVTASDDNTARIWDAATGAPIGEPIFHEQGVTSATFSPNGTRIVTASDDGTARIWHLATGAPVGDPMRHEKGVNSATFSPDGTRILTASNYDTVRIWDAATGAPIGKPMRHEGLVHSTTFSPDGTRIVTASDDGTARIWHLATGAPVGDPMRHEKGVNSATFSPDGTRIVTASDDNIARIWDAATGGSLWIWIHDKQAVRLATFSPDGMRIVTASYDDTARIWNAATGAPIGEPIRHERGVTSATFSPDGTRILTESDDNTVRLWSAQTGAPIGEPMRHEDDVNSATFSPDGTRIVTVSDLAQHASGMQP